jgi:O-antigen ligase
MWANLTVQLVGVLILGWAAVAGKGDAEGRSALALNLILMAGLVVILLQLIPLHPGLWRALPGRDTIAEGYALLGYPLPALPISEAPYASVLTFFAAIPAISMLVAVERLRPSPRALAGAILAGVVLGTMLGAVQLAGGPLSPAYLYKITNPGAVGFFANRNHMATLLLTGIPMAAALVGSTKVSAGSSAKYAMAAAMIFVVGLGIVLNRSFAAYGLVVPVALASAALLPAAVKWRRFAVPIAIVALIGSVAVLVSAPISSEKDPEIASSVTGRTEIWSTTIEATAASMPFGTGLGTFPLAYRLYENPDDVGRFYVNHAHNDYLELVLELGVAGLILILLFLAWWVVTAIRIWTSPLSTPFARAATIGSATILVHSLVDFPLRTGAISAIFAVCVGLMAQHLRTGAVAKPGELRPSRHVKIG